MTTMDFNAGALRSALASYAIVADVQARTSFPHTVSISVSERPPVAELLSAGQRTAVAADGTVLGPALSSSSLPSVSAASKPCPQYQFTFTIKSMVPVLLGGVTNTVPNTTTGIIAGDANGDTYREVNLSGMGPWASQSGSVEFIHVKNLSTMMDYIVNVTKGTYEEFPIHQHTPPANWQGKGPDNGAGTSNRPTPVVGLDSSSGYPCNDAETTTITHNIQIQLANGPTAATITTHRVFCPDLKLVLEEDHSDPRFGTRTYQLSGYNPSPSASLFLPPFGLSTAPTLVQRNKSEHWHRRGPGGQGQQAPATP
jgi:hypothetical protein